MEYEHIEHPFEPIYTKNSKILILGSLPSVSSRKRRFYYGHPQNRFWRVLAAVLNEGTPETVEEKKRMLYDNGIALWDVIAACDIRGSSDSSIRNVVPTDIRSLLPRTQIRRIYTNGQTAWKLFTRYQPELSAAALPSTSPANAAYSLETLISVWKEKLSEDVSVLRRV